MYNNRFSFYIVGDNDKTEKILSNAVPLEDSVYSFFTVSELPETLPLDSAVIADGGLAHMDGLKETHAGELVTIITDTEFFGANKERLDMADDLWIVPASNRYDETSILLGFERLAKRMKLKADNRKLNVCLTTAIDSIPDLVWFKDDIGSHLIVNDGFCRAVEKTKEQIYKRGHYYIWDIPKEEYEQGEYVCLESEDIVMEARHTCLFDEKVKTKSGMRQFKTYKSPLIDADGTLFGTCGVAHDVTDFDNINSEIRVILESMPFGTVLYDRGGTIISVNDKFKTLFDCSDEIIGISFSDWKKSALSSDNISINGKRLVLNTDEAVIILNFTEETIYDIFGEKMGTLGVFNDVTLLEENERRAIEFANTDFLTGLYNRRKLFSYLNEIEDAENLSMITVDLDNFKKVNDTYGHQAGDEALVFTADTLRQCFKNDFIARLGGDEFLVVIERKIGQEQLEAETQNMLNEICGIFSSHEELSLATASAGIAFSDNLSGDMHGISELMKESDQALYKAKKSGKSQYCILKC